MIAEMLSYGFMCRALVVGTLVSLCAALLGVSLVLKRYAMIGDGLSHVGFGALSVALAMNLSPLKVSVPVVVLAAFGLLRLSENQRIKGDSAIALISTSSMAIGVIVTSLSGGMNVDVYGYMFGSILSMNMEDVYLSVGLSAVVLFLFFLFYHRIFAVTFDENFARATGIRADRYNILLALLTAVTVVLGMRMMGTLLISSLIIFPALSAMRVFKRFLWVVLCAALISVLCFFAGMTASFSLSIPTGASVVIANLTCYLLMSLVGTITLGRG
jgi:zinc transport system permease protein